MALFEEEKENIESRRKEFIQKQEQEIKDIENEIKNIKKDNKKKIKLKNLNIKKIYLYLSIPFVLLPGYIFMGFNTFHVTPFIIDKDKYFKTWKTDIDYLGNKNETVKYENSFEEKNKLYYSSGWYQREDGRYENENRIYDVNYLSNNEIYEIVQENDELKLVPLKDHLISTTKTISKTEPKEGLESSIKAEIYGKDENDIIEEEETEKTNNISTLSYLGIVCVGEYLLKKYYPKTSIYKYLKRNIEELDEKYKPIDDKKLLKRLSIIKENYDVLTRR